MNGKYLFLVAALILAALIAPVSAEVLFHDDFDGATPTGTYTSYRYSAQGGYSCSGGALVLSMPSTAVSGTTRFNYLNYNAPALTGNYEFSASLLTKTPIVTRMLLKGAGITTDTSAIVVDTWDGNMRIMQAGTVLETFAVANEVYHDVTIQVSEDRTWRVKVDGGAWHEQSTLVPAESQYPALAMYSDSKAAFSSAFGYIDVSTWSLGIPATVVVQDAATGNTIDAAQVTVMGYNSVIDTFYADEETDLVAISVPSPGTYQAVVTRQGYTSEILDMTVTTAGQNFVAGLNSYSAPTDYQVLLLPDTFSIGTRPVALVTGGNLAPVETIVHVFGDTAYYTSAQESGWGEEALIKRIDGIWFKRDETTYEFTIPVADPYVHVFGAIPKSDQYKYAVLLRGVDGGILHSQETFVHAGQVQGYTFVLPENPAPGFGISAWLHTSDASLALANRVFYTLGDMEYFASNLERGWGKTIGFKMVNGTWYRDNEVTGEFDIPVDDPRSASFAPFPHAGTYKFMGYVMSPQETLYEQTDSLSVGNPDDVATVTVYVKDAETAALIAGANVTITGPAGVLIGTQVTASGIATFEVPKTTYPEYWVSVTAPYYSQVSPHLMAVMQDIGVTIEMNPEGEPPADPNNVYLQFVVRDHNLNPVSGASITVGGETLTTNDAGFVRFEVAKSTRHTYLVSKAGYMTVSGSVDAGTVSPVNMPVVLTSGVYPTSTGPTVEPTGQPTDQPTGEPTGEPTGQPPTTPGTSFVDQSAQGFATFLGVSFEMGKAALGVVIAAAVGFATARRLRGGAAEFGIGLLAGACLTVIIGLLPVWIFIVLMMVVGALIGYRYMGGGQ